MECHCQRHSHSDHMIDAVSEDVTNGDNGNNIRDPRIMSSKVAMQSVEYK